MALMLKLKAAFSNFDEAVRSGDGMWDPGLPMCASWQGVTCWPDGSVRSITLSIPALTPPLPVPNADNASSAHGSVNHQLAGKTFMKDH